MDRLTTLKETNMNKYKILFDYGSEGHQFQDEEFDTVAEAVKHAVDLNYSTRFKIVKIIDWEASIKCPYPDCPKVHYKECEIHGV
jgi:hypothetical protein